MSFCDDSEKKCLHFFFKANLNQTRLKCDLKSEAFSVWRQETSGRNQN